MCIAGYAMSAAPVDPVFGNSAAEVPRFRYHLLNHHQLGVEHDYRRDLPDAAGRDRRGRNLLALHRAERRLYRRDVLADPRNQKTSPWSILNAG